MRAVVLVGGQGTRLRPLTLTAPKQMLPVGGRPMIERVLAHLRSHGIDEVVLSLGYKPDAFTAAYPDGACAGVRLAYAVEDSPLDTAGAIAFAARQAGIGEAFVVVNGDVLTGLDLGGLIDAHRRAGAEATIALTPVPDPSAFGVVPTDDDGRVQAFIEKPAPGEAPTNLINAGTYVLEWDVLERIPSGRRVSIERETFPGLVAGGTLYAFGSDAPWRDAGTPATYLAANLDLAQPDVGSVSHSWVDPKATVAEGAVVRDSVLFPGATVEAGATVTSSIIGWDALVGAGARVEDLSVLGSGASVPAGAVLSGHRSPADVT
ncbi:MAG: sugar phosphate nucleotidyltransferase [Acidimicrobiales bacterium]